jgi:hypothetical protein
MVFKKELLMKRKKGGVYQRSLPFYEPMVWQQIPLSQRAEVIRLLTKVIKEHYYLKEDSLVE